MKTINREVGQRIRDQREYQKLTREKLSEMANISSQFLSDIETVKKGMTVITLSKLCNALHISADSVVFGIETEDVEYRKKLNSLIATVPQDKQEKLEEIVQKVISLL